MVNWYRALLAKAMPPSARLRVSPPILLIWGERDASGVRALAEDSLALCEDGHSLFVPEATHWSHHDAPETCLAAMLDFLGSRVQLPA